MKTLMKPSFGIYLVKKICIEELIILFVMVSFYEKLHERKTAKYGKCANQA